MPKDLGPDSMASISEDQFRDVPGANSKQQSLGDINFDLIGVPGQHPGHLRDIVN